MKELWTIKWFLGINISQKPEVSYLTQTPYIDKILQWFYMFESKQKSVPLSAGKNMRSLAYTLPETKTGKYPYRELIGSLLDYTNVMVT